MLGLAMTLAALWGGAALDRLLGEPRRFHPLNGFGTLAGGLERSLNRGRGRRGAGVLALLLAVVPLAALGWGLTLLLPEVLVGGVALWLALGARSLEDHARAVAEAFAGNDLEAARQKVGYIVSRDTAALDAPGVATACVESVLENGNDAIFAALFWFAVAGVPGVVLYRLVNTLDALWGYRTERFAAFGWAAARLDDLLNLIPARLTALVFVLLAGRGRRGDALSCWMWQGRTWKSPNAGPVMAAGAGALGVRLGGPAPYHGQWQDRPALGLGEAATPADIPRAITLIRRATLVWLGSISMVWGGLAVVL